MKKIICIVALSMFFTIEIASEKFTDRQNELVDLVSMLSFQLGDLFLNDQEIANFLKNVMVRKFVPDVIIRRDGSCIEISVDVKYVSKRIIKISDQCNR